MADKKEKTWIEQILDRDDIKKWWRTHSPRPWHGDVTDKDFDYFRTGRNMAQVVNLATAKRWLKGELAKRFFHLAKAYVRLFSIANDSRRTANNLRDQKSWELKSMEDHCAQLKEQRNQVAKEFLRLKAEHLAFKKRIAEHFGTIQTVFDLALKDALAPKVSPTDNDAAELVWHMSRDVAAANKKKVKQAEKNRCTCNNCPLCMNENHGSE